MNQEIFTVEQVSEMFNLHPKTVRDLIRNGRLKAAKVGKQWRISRSSLQVLMSDEFNYSLHLEKNMDSLSSLENEPLENLSVQVSAVVDVLTSNRNEVDRISGSLQAIMNGKSQEDGHARFDTIFFPEEKKTRFILWGMPGFIGKVLLCIAEITK